VTDRSQSTVVDRPLARHLARGAVGFGLIGAAIVLGVRVGAPALLPAILGMVCLRGCPTCWTVALIELVTAGGLRGDCGSDGCALRSASSR
jgi:hypothetical protein